MTEEQFKKVARFTDLKCEMKKDEIKKEEVKEEKKEA